MVTQYPMDSKSQKVPVQIRVNMWLGLSAHEKKFNSFSEGTFSVFAEMVKHLSRTPPQSPVAQPGSGTKGVSCHCVTVREPSPGVWELGDYRTGGAPQVLRCDREAEAEAGVLHPSAGMEVGERLVHRPRESVRIPLKTATFLFFIQHCSIVLWSSGGSGFCLRCLHSSHTHRDLRTQHKQLRLNLEGIYPVNDSYSPHTASVSDSVCVSAC